MKDTLLPQLEKITIRFVRQGYRRSSDRGCPVNAQRISFACGVHRASGHNSTCGGTHLRFRDANWRALAEVEHQLVADLAARLLHEPKGVAVELAGPAGSRIRVRDLARLCVSSGTSVSACRERGQQVPVILWALRAPHRGHCSVNHLSVGDQKLPNWPPAAHWPRRGGGWT